MIKVIMHGCGGKMGHVVADIVKNDENYEMVAGIDPRGVEAEFPTFTTSMDCNIDADVIIDFSTAAAIPSLLEFAKAKKIPVVLCTTGLDEQMLKIVSEASKEVAILKSANMSVGVNLLINLIQKATQTLVDSGFDIEIVEKHHNQKIDAPSGTALAFADAINEKLDNSYEYVYDRSQKREKRSKKEIGLHAVRGGTIVGEHDIIFAGKDEIVTFSHSAMSKEVFAVGAVKAAKFLCGKGPGLYNMKNVMDEI